MSSLGQLLKNHQQKQADTKRQNDQLRKDCAKSMNELTDRLTDQVNQGVSDIFGRQKELEQESRKLGVQTSRYVKQTKQWVALVDDFNSSLKELGDVKHWAELMEHDMRTVMATLEFVHQGAEGKDSIQK
ncbi:GCN5L1 domain contining transcription factor [Phycomyces blakesleeanus]|uniref:Biogenesis of lysosome-related organelles complex 1 subunit 1 n=2 Tax=Phycomyces blakesleeanus TaxID=4837 RepID=A0A162Y118_PHYB8|nr:GCN5L1 domain contining transcription factor [Phycomyces blakesleeanus NRRL 1555(-)]OAD77765.1 GCN5L1 domain contining transcription factor [Phycomyces blakesleeanus NRRL 1555(-)]|eukprot:XP_018295805.1 GCN5L1 domain contining transcription factor [Phycomyces blakesleeanus NRRL 1555(-)]